MGEGRGNFKIGKQEAKRDIFQAGGDIKITYHPPSEKEPLTFPFPPSLHNQTPPEPNFVGRKEMLETITEWYNNPEVRIGALIGWGGVGKSALVRKWYDTLESNRIKPDGIFWWGFYRNAYLEQFLNALLRYVSQGRIEPETIKSTWEKTDRIKEYVQQGAYLIILDGLEEMQKSESGDEFGKMIHRECTELLHYLADVPKTDGLCLITTRYPLKDLNAWHERSYKHLSLSDLNISDSLLMLRRHGVKGSDEEMTEVINRYEGHALRLTLLARYLVEYFEGDIKKIKQLPNLNEDETGFSPFVRILNQNVAKLTPIEKDLLKVLSCFLVPIDQNVLVCLIHHEVSKVAPSLIDIDKNLFEFLKYLHNLENRGLIVKDSSKYSIHPLISSYFFRQLKEDEQLTINQLIQICLHEAIVSPKVFKRPPVIFLSHNHKDRPFVRKLSINLKKHGIESWLDEAEIGVGDSLIEKIQQAIKNVEYFAVILSPNSVNSSWVRKELEVAMSMEIERKRVFVLPILYKNCELPPFLKTKRYADFLDSEVDQKKFSMGVSFIVESVMSRRKKL